MGIEVRFSIPEKVGALPVKGGEEGKRTNEIKIAAPLLNEIDIKGRTITADVLLTQRMFADYLVNERHAHYHLTVKGNQSTVLENVRLYFKNRKEPDFVEPPSLQHGRIETRKIGITTALNGYLNFSNVRMSRNPCSTARI